MIVVPTDLSAATELIAKLNNNLDNYRAQLDNLTSVQQTTARAFAVQAEELKVTVKELEQARADLEIAYQTIAQLDADIDHIRAERDTFRAQASVTR